MSHLIYFIIQYKNIYMALYAKNCSKSFQG